MALLQRLKSQTNYQVLGLGLSSSFTLLQVFFKLSDRKSKLGLPPSQGDWLTRLYIVTYYTLHSGNKNKQWSAWLKVECTNHYLYKIIKDNNLRKIVNLCPSGHSHSSRVDNGFKQRI